MLQQTSICNVTRAVIWASVRYRWARAISWQKSSNVVTRPQIRRQVPPPCQRTTHHLRQWWVTDTSRPVRCRLPTPPAPVVRGRWSSPPGRSAAPSGRRRARRPLLWPGRRRQRSPMRAGLCQRGVRTRNHGVEHLRRVGAESLLSDVVTEDHVMSRVWRHGRQVESSVVTSHRPQQPEQRHLLALGASYHQQQRQPHSQSWQKVRGIDVIA